MAGTKAPAKKRTGAAVKKGRGATLSASHKKALAEGRTMSAAIDRYVTVINTPKQRGRKISVDSLETRLRKARSELPKATGVEKVLTAQEIRDLEVRIARMMGGSGADIKPLEREFIKVAKRFSEKRGITYGAWRAGGVSAEVLKKAGIARTRG